ncbi:MAG: proline iminopeptidase-family hydrolase [candidate division Zixibacteria bacterium]|nr:proline iminopeptidase-family hydrolase [candidate division Zixibacteria bacterium]
MKRLIFILMLFGHMTVTALSYGQTDSLSAGEGFIEVTGGKVWYKIVGGGTSIPLLMLHGGRGVSSIYLKPLEALADQRPVVFFDQLGCGNSPGPSDTSLWTIENFVEQIAAVRKALNLKQVHLYGHSWGTMLAIDYMLGEPTGVQSLVLAGPVFSIERHFQDKVKLLETLPDSISKVIKKNELEGTLDSPDYMPAMMVFLGQFFARKQPWSDELNQAFATMNHSLGVYMFGPLSFHSTGTLAGYNRIERLSEIKSPTLLIAGEYDISRPATAKHYQSLIPGAELTIIENAGHLTMHDNAEADIKAIREFLHKVENE